MQWSSNENISPSLTKETPECRDLMGDTLCNASITTCGVSGALLNFEIFLKFIFKKTKQIDCPFNFLNDGRSWWDCDLVHFFVDWMKMKIPSEILLSLISITNSIDKELFMYLNILFTDIIILNVFVETFPWICLFIQMIKFKCVWWIFTERYIYRTTLYVICSKGNLIIVSTLPICNTYEAVHTS